jgi:hypothetical protein
MNSRLYILVLRKLSKSQKMAQACHAVAGWCLANPEGEWQNNTVVILEVDDVGKWVNGLRGIPHYAFHEPYWDGLCTSLASPYIGDKVTHLKLA